MASPYKMSFKMSLMAPILPKLIFSFNTERGTLLWRVAKMQHPLSTILDYGADEI